MPHDLDFFHIVIVPNTKLERDFFYIIIVPNTKPERERERTTLIQCLLIRI